MKDFEKEVITRLTKIETKLDDYKKIEQNSCDALNLSKQNEKDILEMKENSKWLWRTVLGSIVVFVFNLLYGLFK